MDTEYGDLLAHEAASVWVTGPDGQTVSVAPVVIYRRLSMTTVHELLFDQGQASFAFTPPAPGRYQVLVRWNGWVPTEVIYHFDVTP